MGFRQILNRKVPALWEYRNRRTGLTAYVYIKSNVYNVLIYDNDILKYESSENGINFMDFDVASNFAKMIIEDSLA